MKFIGYSKNKLKEKDYKNNFYSNNNLLRTLKIAKSIVIKDRQKKFQM